MTDFVPDGFSPPLCLISESFKLAPLGPQHNEQDYAAWMSSIDHIRATPGFTSDSSWPTPMSLEDNLADLEMHARHFSECAGFTYTVLDVMGEVAGCVYIYPTDDQQYSADVRSWVRSSDAHLDVLLWRAVTNWLDTDWPFSSVHYAER